MQIEKHIKIIPTPTGAVVFFAGQVCLNIGEHSGRYTWSISPVFARLTTGISTCFEVPMCSWDGQPTLAEAIADGLTKLDDMQAFYGVIDIPEDTYVGQHLDEGADYSGIHADVKRTGKTHEQLAAEHRAYAKQMRAIGKDGLAVRSEMLADDHDKAIADSKKTNESVEDEELLAESFVVRNSIGSKTSPSRVMISAAAVINRAREMAKEAGEKTHAKFIKLAHSEIASNMKAESVEELEEGSGPKEKQKTPFRDINSPEYKAAAQKQKQQMSKDAAAKPGQALLFKIKNEEFVQYEDAVAEALQAIKKDCRAEALSMSDSLVEAHQLAQELFEDIVEEYLNELSKGTLASYAKKANVERSNPHMDDEKADHRGSGVMQALDKLAGKKAGPLKGKAITARFAAATRDPKADKKVTDFDKSVDKHVKEETKKPKFDIDVKQKRSSPAKPLTDAEKKQPFDYKEWKNVKEDLDEAVDHKELLDLAQKAYIEATRKGNGVMARSYGADIEKHKAAIARIKKLKLKEEVEELGEAARFAMDDIAVGGTVIYKTLKGDHKISKVRNKGNGFALHLQDGSTIQNHAVRSTDASDWKHFENLKEEVEELDEATRPLSGDAYWKSKEAESKEEFLKAQRKTLGLPEPVKRGRGKPTNIDRDLLKTRAHSNVEAGKRPTAGFDRNEKIHFVRHLKDHPDFAEKHVSQAGRPVGTTKVAGQQKELAKKKQDSAFSMWAGLGKK